MTVFVLKQLIGQLFRGGHLLFFSSTRTSLPFLHMPGWLSEGGLHSVMCVEDGGLSDIITKNCGCAFIRSGSPCIFGFFMFCFTLQSLSSEL